VKGDLERLIAAVEAGTLCQGEVIGVEEGALIDGAISEAGSTENLWEEVDLAMNGSLDAALRLHEALLPGWTVDNMGQRAGGWRVQIGRFDGKTPRPAPEAMVPDNPARAWLLAILRALAKREEG
jgi:hypothetical protein